MRVNFKIKNNINLDKYTKEAKVVLRNELARSAINITNDAKRYASGRPGPNVVTGFLRNSIQVAEYPTTNNLEAKVIVNAEYGKYVEYGTRRSRPYPFFNPAVAKEKARLESSNQTHIILREIIK